MISKASKMFSWLREEFINLLVLSVMLPQEDPLGCTPALPTHVDAAQNRGLSVHVFVVVVGANAAVNKNGHLLGRFLYNIKKKMYIMYTR